jgi:spore coat protein H
MVCVWRALLALGLSLALGCAEEEPDRDYLVFDDSFVHEISITVDEGDLSRLKLGSEERVKADFSFDGRLVEKVGIRLKGQTSGRELDGKASFNVKFDEFVRHQSLYGVQKLVLNAELQFPYFFGRRISYEIWRRAGVPAARTTYAKVSFNGEYFGLYLIEEAYNKQFLKKNFADASGNLYEGNSTDLTDIAGVELDTNETENDRADLEALAAALAVPDDRLLAEVGKQVDLEQLYTYWAVERLVYHWDGYGTVREEDDCCSPNNYYLYRDPTQKRFVFLPRGSDQVFHMIDDPAQAGTQIPGSNVGKPPAADATLAARLFALPEVRARLAQRMEEILDTVWNPEELRAYLDSTAGLIFGGFVEGAREERSVGGLEFTFEQVERFLRQRPEFVRARLAEGL